MSRKYALKAGLNFWLGGLVVIALFTGCLTSSDNSSSSLSISTQPSDATVNEGGTATFSVSASGSGTLTYQWMNGSNALTDTSGISGSKTNTLKITGVMASDGGASFTCVVSDGTNSVTSNPALLKVNVPVTSMTATMGAQGNATNGSFLDLDNMTDYLVGEINTNGNAADIDLFFGYGTSGAAIYSPDVAAGANGFTIAQNTLGSSANVTHIRSVSVNFTTITNKAQIDALWASASDVSGGKLVINNGDTFLAESNLGLIVLVQVSNLVQAADGTVTLTGLSKF